MTNKNVDCIIIGSGQGGTSLAGALAKQGQRVVLFERDRLGGSCVNYGCTPSKAMLAAAHAIGYARRAPDLGVNVAIEPDFNRIMRRVRDIRKQWQESVSGIRSQDNVEIIGAEAHFEDAHSVRGGDAVRQAPRIIINTGRSSAIPPIDGLEGLPYLTNNNIFDLTELPRRTCVLGGGYVGLELGQALARFGSQVTIVDRGGRILKREVRRVGHTLQKSLEKDGIVFRLGQSAEQVSHENGVFHVRFEKAEPIEADALLVATGRMPNTAALHAERAGVELDDDGYVRVNDLLETTAQGIYAIGDCARQPAFTHVSSEDRLRLESIWQHTRGAPPRRRDDRVLGYAVFTDPSVGRVGMDEQQARDAGLTVNVRRTELSDTARGREWNLTDGYFELIADADTGRLLGATFVGYEAAEMVQMFLPLIEQQLRVQAVAEAVFIHPTFGEALMMLARGFADG
jgi:dihydrolipoamide dehydrogenase